MVTTRREDSVYIYSADGKHLFRLFFDVVKNPQGKVEYDFLRLQYTPKKTAVKVVKKLPTDGHMQEVSIVGVDTGHEWHKKCWLWDEKYRRVPPRNQCREMLAEGIKSPHKAPYYYDSLPK